MRNLFEISDRVTLTISGHDENRIHFSSIDLNYTYSQIPLSKKTSLQGNSNIVRGDDTGSYRFKTGFHGLGNMP